MKPPPSRGDSAAGLPLFFVDLELRPATAFDPDAVVVHAPGASFDAGRPRQLAEDAHAPLRVDRAMARAFLDRVATHDLARRFVGDVDHHAELGAAAAGHPHAARIRAPVLAAQARVL